MRTKLFLAFFVIILTALVSNFIFEGLILDDFEDYVMSAREDRLYLVLASVEGSYDDYGWNLETLYRYLHWATMLGFEVEVRDAEGNTVLTSRNALNTVSPTMRRRLEAIVNMDAPVGEAEEYPLFVKGEEVGTLLVRPLSTEGLAKVKGAVFKNRGKDFLVISFVIAGGGAVFLSIVFSMFLTRPIRRLKDAASQVATGDLSVRVTSRSSDEIGELTAAFNRMVESLEREETLRQRLISNIAHELRTPLTVMKAHIEAVRDGVVEEDVGSIHAEVERLIELVEGIEDITKAEASFFKRAEYEKVDVRALMDGILQGMRPMFSEKGLELAFQTGEPLEVSTDVEKLEIIVRNILSNALKHTEQGNVLIDYGMDKKEFFVEVRDSGRGIPEDELPNIFRRFFKGEESTGIGLGLAIVKELTEIMGGKVDVRSTPGKGSAFRVTLPVGTT
jgi:two-component system sensor histidine kinase BaeS